MLAYKPGDTFGLLQDWPFENPDSNYLILSGTPKASGRIDTGGSGDITHSGIWYCTKGIFECTEQGDELMNILSGRCRLTNQVTGQVSDLVIGDSLFVHDGSRIKWEIIEDVTKVFFGCKSAGF